MSFDLGFWPKQSNSLELYPPLRVVLSIASVKLIPTNGIGRYAMAVVLIVEDEVFIRLFAEEIVQDMGHEPLVASDMDEALAHLRSPQPIDALFADIRLKSVVLGGFALARDAVKFRPALRVLYTTGNSMNETMRALFVEGARFIQKPYSPDQLQTSLKELLGAAL
jgi:CheY-like chemotaxis protein